MSSYTALVQSFCELCELYRVIFIGEFTSRGKTRLGIWSGGPSSSANGEIDLARRRKEP